MEYGTGEELFKKILTSRKMLVLTGAGISTEAGIPDFQSLDSEWNYRWPRHVVFSRNFMHKRPDRFWKKFTETFLAHDKSIAPTSMHQDLAKLESLGKDVAIVTQNVDGLHQKAGSTNVYEVHGNVKTVSCRKKEKCGWTGPLTDDIKQKALMEAPKCPQCDFYLRPDIVLFDEQVSLAPAWNFNKNNDVDLLLVMGTSGDVMPVAGFPQLFLAAHPEIYAAWLNLSSPLTPGYDSVVIGKIGSISKDFREHAQW